MYGHSEVAIGLPSRCYVWRHCLDQGLARDSLEDNATVPTFVRNLELKFGVAEIIKTKHFTKEGFAGKITSRAGECTDKI